MASGDQLRNPRKPLAAGLLLLVSTVATGGPQAAGSTDGQTNAPPPDYWTLPVAPQGEAPQEWSEPERSLSPEACAACHQDQHAEWRTSLHAAAFSPGLVGQLVSMSPEGAGSCMNCHAPLSEQRADFVAALTAGAGHLPERQGLAAEGVVCAACHARAHRRFGPPQRDTGAIGQSDPDGPHGGVYRAAWFESSEFCAVCHQFPQAYAVNGKPLQNTVAEWRASPQAAQGITCQDCHMPARKHLWRGIHDPEMAAAGLTARFQTGPVGARFDLTNSGVGHAFPTYVTPKVVMHAVALDGEGEPRPETAVSYVIRRSVGFAGGRWLEHSDTRLFPGEAASLGLAWQGSDVIRMWLEIHPDDYYDHQVYDLLLRQLAEHGAAARMISEADSRARASRYRIFETELKRLD